MILHKYYYKYHDITLFCITLNNAVKLRFLFILIPYFTYSNLLLL